MCRRSNTIKKSERRTSIGWTPWTCWSSPPYSSRWFWPSGCSSEWTSDICTKPVWPWSTVRDETEKVDSLLIFFMSRLHHRCFPAIHEYPGEEIGHGQTERHRDLQEFHARMDLLRVRECNISEREKYLAHLGIIITRAFMSMAIKDRIKKMPCPSMNTRWAHLSLSFYVQWGVGIRF